MLFTSDGKRPMLQVSKEPPGPPQDGKMAGGWGTGLLLFLAPMVGGGWVRRRKVC
jgi:hypothetical protein